FTSSIMGGIIGALALMAALPILRPLILSLGAPELFMVALLGLAMIGSLTGKEPLIGLSLGLFGLLLSQIGIDFQTGIAKWTFGQPCLLDGLPEVPAILGLFALPEVMELVGRGKTIAQVEAVAQVGRDVVQGIRDSFRHWLLVVRSSLL